MVFSKLLNTINSAFDNSKKNIRKRNIKPINELQQGMQLLQSRKQVLNILSNKQLMSTEPMSSGLFKEGEDKLNSVNKKELDALKKWKQILIKVYHHTVRNINPLWKIIIEPLSQLKNVNLIV